MEMERSSILLVFEREKKKILRKKLSTFWRFSTRKNSLFIRFRITVSRLVVQFRNDDNVYSSAIGVLFFYAYEYRGNFLYVVSDAMMESEEDERIIDAKIRYSQRYRIIVLEEIKYFTVYFTEGKVYLYACIRLWHELRTIVYSDIEKACNSTCRNNDDTAVSRSFRY